jgi:hypothetical protein
MFRIVFTHDDIDDIKCPSLEAAKKLAEEYEAPCAIMSVNDKPILFYVEEVGFMYQH